MQVALVHDWLVAHRGGERVLLELARMFPRAPIYTLVCQRDFLHPELRKREVHTSFVQRLPFSPQGFRRYLPLFPRAIEAFDLGRYDLVISTSHCVAKGIRTPGHTKHLSYIHTPMRYAWDQQAQYLPSWTPQVGAQLAHIGAAWLRRWDVASASRADVLVANSNFVASRILDYWHREAAVVHPPVDIELFEPDVAGAREGFLVAGALVGYKRADLAIEMANRYRLALTVVGEGPMERRLRKLAGPPVNFTRAPTHQELARLYQRVKGLLFCGVEDFGIVPVEAMASGTPVVALGRGGALDTIVDQGDPKADTGVFFSDTTPESVYTACNKLLDRWEAGFYAPKVLRHHVEAFSPSQFRDKIDAQLSALRWL